MGYLKIPNLYNSPEILEVLGKVYCLEKIHGTSAHIKMVRGSSEVIFFSGGSKMSNFMSLFDTKSLLERFAEMDCDELTIYGEAYGGKVQSMKDVYGENLRFVAFDVAIGGKFVSGVPTQQEIVESFGLEFVHYTLGPSTKEFVNQEREKFSEQAKRNGLGSDKVGEGIIIRPLIELTLNNGSRFIFKHKRDDFRETKSVRKLEGQEKVIWEDAEKVAEEFVVPMRVEHVLDKLIATRLIPETYTMSHVPLFIHAMVEDIKCEERGTIKWSKNVTKAISKKAAILFGKKVNSRV